MRATILVFVFFGVGEDWLISRNDQCSLVPLGTPPKSIALQEQPSQIWAVVDYYREALELVLQIFITRGRNCQPSFIQIWQISRLIPNFR